jgi:thioredoxin reductase (NADPH)
VNDLHPGLAADRSPSHWEVLVIGAGPAGLTAACYLARYRRRVLVVHDQTSRALRIPLTHNAPGFPGGVVGADLVGRMQEQAELYGAIVKFDRIVSLRRTAEGFAVHGDLAYVARSVILATGARLNQVDLPAKIHEDAMNLGCLRYCPVCDGYEATGKAVAVIGSSARGAREALFLREYTNNITLVPQKTVSLTDDQRAELQSAGVRVLDQAVRSLEPMPQGMRVTLATGDTLTFDVLYPALGRVPRAELARQLGLVLAEDGCLPGDAHERSPEPGLFAAGDVVEGLDQISVAVGHGAIAATRAHNFLRELEGRVLQAN